MDEVKPGWKTTEFWLTTLTALSGVLGQIQGIIPAPYGIIAGAIVTCAYTIARGLAKKPS